MQEAHFEIIDRYISGEMNPEEREQFEQRMNSDPEIRKDLEEFALLKDGVEREILRDLMNRFHNELKSEKKPSTRHIILKRFAYAASILIFLGVGTVWVIKNSYSDGQRIFDRHFIADPGLPTTMGASSRSYVFSDGMVDYKLGEYKKAIAKWKSLLPDNPGGDTLNYFIGAAYLADGDAGKAIEFMKKAEENNQGGLKKDIEFYLGMAYLKLDSLSPAVVYLNKAGTDKSKTILEEIEENGLRE